MILKKWQTKPNLPRSVTSLCPGLPIRTCPRGLERTHCHGCTPQQLSGVGGFEESTQNACGKTTHRYPLCIFKHLPLDPPELLLRTNLAPSSKAHEQNGGEQQGHGQCRRVRCCHQVSELIPTGAVNPRMRHQGGAESSMPCWTDGGVLSPLPHQRRMRRVSSGSLPPGVHT